MRTVNQEKFEARRLQVREAALACFKRKGFHQASMADICAEAGMSPGNLYRYYDSKEAVIAAICEADLRRVTGRLERLGQRQNLFESMLEIAGEAMSASDHAWVTKQLGLRRIRLSRLRARLEGLRPSRPHRPSR